MPEGPPTCLLRGERIPYDELRLGAHFNGYNSATFIQNR